MKPLQLRFNIYVPGEKAAGIIGFEDTVVVTVNSGDPGGEPGEFEEHIRGALIEWYDGGNVVLDPAYSENKRAPELYKTAKLLASCAQFKKGDIVRVTYYRTDEKGVNWYLLGDKGIVCYPEHHLTQFSL